MSKTVFLWDSAESFARGTQERLSAAGEALTLSLSAPAMPDGGCCSGYASRGVFTSRETPAPVFSALVVSWNAAVPRGTAVELAVRVRAGEAWSSWQTFGVWGVFRTRAGGGAREDALVHMENGVLTVKDPAGAGAFQLRAVLLTADRSVSPVLRLAAVSVQPTAAAAAAAPQECVPTRRSIPVPAYSQAIRDPHLGDALSGPVCLTMLLNRHGEDLLPEEVAHVCRDSENGWNNPGFLAAAAGCYGYESYVCFAGLPLMKQEVRAGAACMAQVHYAGSEVMAQQLGLPLLEGTTATAQQHFVVVRGFECDDAGAEFVLVNDPLASCDNAAQRRYPLAQFAAACTGLVLVLHRLDKLPVVCRPQRICGTVSPSELPGEYALYVEGERHSLSPLFAQGDGADCTGTVCYTVRDAHAYATAAHKCFFYTGITPSGNIRLDTAHLPAGTRMSIYLINSFGECIVADYTV